MPCNEPCDVALDHDRRRGIVWNVSVGGAYLMLIAPLPLVGQAVRVAFSLPGDASVIECEARVAWHNPQSTSPGFGAVAAALPAGCGLEFVRIAPSDQERIDARVKRRT